MSPPGQHPSAPANDAPNAPGASAGPVPGSRPESSTATALARSHIISPQPEGGPLLTDRLEELERQLRASYQFFAQETAANRVPSQASEWLLDNFYVVQQATRQIREDMPKGFYSQLPKLAATPLKGHPRVYAMARTMTESDHGTLDLERVKRFVQDYQRITPLTMGEIWALPTMLRMGLVECLVGTLAQIRGASGVPEGDPSAAQSPPPTVPEESAVGDCILSLRAVAN